MYDRKQHIHLVGIGGVGMAGIAEVLLNLGYTVTGSDIKRTPLVEHLISLGAAVTFGHSAENLPPQTAVVVLSSAIRRDNPEVVEAERRKLSIIPRAEMLGELMRMKYGVAVAGSHGKTTTTSMIAKILGDAGLDPTVIVGGRVLTQTSGARVGTGEYLVAETDESDGSFCLLRPAIAIVTNIDAEHLSYYGSFGALESSFQQFMSSIPFYGLVVGCYDDPVVRRLCESLKRRVRSYGLSPGHDVVASDLQAHGLHSSFRVAVKGGQSGLVRLPMAGAHMVSNSLAAIAVGIELDVGLDQIIQSLASFPGVSRRTEVLYQDQETLVIDDYAHHPREIAATLRALKGSLAEHSGQSGVARSGGRLIALFQPHRFSRTRELFSEFVGCFADADRVVIGEVYPAGEDPIPGISGEALASALAHPCSCYAADLGSYSHELFSLLLPGDIVVYLGAGSVTTTAHQFAEQLRLVRQKQFDVAGSSEKLPFAKIIRNAVGS